jgi:ABC-2 type transport system ATP-binding protein
LIEPLGKVPGVKEVALFGRGLHLVVDDFQKVKPALDESLSKLNIPAQNLKKIEPSLEDVFVSLIEERERREKPQQEFRQ